MADDATVNDLLAIGQAARRAQRELALCPPARKNEALVAMAHRLRGNAVEILKQNALDLRRAEAAGLRTSLIDRLRLDPQRIETMAATLTGIAAMKDPVGEAIAEWHRPNGLAISRVRVPIGVIGVIFESRPNVAADAGALCLKSGNAVILRGGSDGLNSTTAIVSAMQQALVEQGLPRELITAVTTADRSAVGMMLSGLGGALDLIVPRGGKSLVGRVESEARVPVLSHLEGICHVYVHADADIAKASAIAVNSKMRRTGVCGAAETLLIDRAMLPKAAAIIAALIAAGCEVRGDEEIARLDRRVVPATNADWGTEYLDAIIAVRALDGLAEAIDHIRAHGSQHTDAIVTENAEAAERFLREVDSAIVLHNASTQFADGGEFGFGAEIGIATGRLHARGPVGLEQLTTFKYLLRGSGQIRP
ncbi:MAG TPA: glutamate-5-semialdehyde dehydrogenase [Aestuariivirgaceae bacterium]|jgi:glutamate-5-semialdehyde dehydrogenase